MCYNVKNVFKLKGTHMKFYTGIGARKTPANILVIMRKLAYHLAKDGFTLRSGGADGADTAFGHGWADAWMEDVDNTMHSKYKAEIYLPWEGFNDQYSTMEGRWYITNPSLYFAAEGIASRIHPNWKACKDSVRALHTRNVFQVLGADLTKRSNFLVCWAELDGESIKGGTRTAWELAKQRDVTCYNLYNTYDLDKIQAYLDNK